jgi:proteasome lid subunit RPN8/RPN11
VKLVELTIGEYDDVDICRDDTQALIYYAAIDPDIEVCGIIYKDGRIEQLPNLHENPAVAFDMQIDLGAEIEYVWHSHPRGRPDPSQDDIPHMELLYKYGHNYKWLIIAKGNVRCFQLQDES